MALCVNLKKVELLKLITLTEMEQEMVCATCYESRGSHQNGVL